MSSLQNNKRVITLVIFLSKCLQGEAFGVAKEYSRFRYTSFQHGVRCAASTSAMRPTTLIEIQNVVAEAIKQNFTIKALGGRYSATDIICTSGIPVFMHYINHFKFDSSTKTVTVGAGATLGSVLEKLHKHGRSFHGIPTYADITIGGATGSGSHGSNIQNPTTLSDQVVGVVVVDGRGKVRNITDSETLRAFRAHLGLLGIIYEITLTTTLQYKLQIQHYPEPEEILWRDNAERIHDLAKGNDRFQFFWFPSSKRVVLSVGNRVPTFTPGNCQTHFIPEVPYEMCRHVSGAYEAMQADRNELGLFVAERMALASLHTRLSVGRTPLFTEEHGMSPCITTPAVGYSHQMLVNRCKECPWQHGNASVYQFENSVIIPLTELSEAMKTIREILQTNPTEFPMTGIYFRFLSPSNGLLTMNSGRASVSIEWVLIPRKDRFNKPMMGLPSSQAIMQALIKKHGGRAHWGKNGPLYTQRQFLQENYPQLPTFLKRMSEFDPHGIFMNEFGRRLKYGSQETALDSYSKHCGLVDRCVCQNDEDCGDGKEGSYQCDTIHNYPVCKESGGGYAAFRNGILRNFIVLSSMF